MLYLLLPVAKLKVMNEWPESATSNPATHYASINLHKASDKATSFLNRQNKTVKKKLLPELCELNKSAVSRKLNVLLSITERQKSKAF